MREPRYSSGFLSVPSCQNPELRTRRVCWRTSPTSLPSPSPNTHSSPFLRYEEEIHKRTAAENEFVVLKKVSSKGVFADCRFLGEAELSLNPWSAWRHI